MKSHRQWREYNHILRLSCGWQAALGSLTNANGPKWIFKFKAQFFYRIFAAKNSTFKLTSNRFSQNAFIEKREILYNTMIAEVKYMLKCNYILDVGYVRTFWQIVHLTSFKHWYFNYSWDYECPKQRTWMHNRLQ